MRSIFSPLASPGVVLPPITCAMARTRHSIFFVSHPAGPPIDKRKWQHPRDLYLIVASCNQHAIIFVCGGHGNLDEVYSVWRIPRTMNVRRCRAETNNKSATTPWMSVQVPKQSRFKLRRMSTVSPSSTLMHQLKTLLGHRHLVNRTTWRPQPMFRKTEGAECVFSQDANALAEVSCSRGKGR